MLLMNLQSVIDTCIELAKKLAVRQRYLALLASFDTDNKDPPLFVSTLTSIGQILSGKGSGSGEENKDLVLGNQGIAPTVVQSSSGGLEDFLLLRKGRIDSWKTSIQAADTQPSKTSDIQS